MKKTFHKGIALAISLALIVSVCLLGGTATASETVGYTVTTTTGSTSDPIDPSRSIINGKTPTEFSGVTELTNGLNAQRALTSVKTLSFDLGGYKKISEVKIISQNQSNAASRLGNYEIYMSDSLTYLYDTSNRIAVVNPEVPSAGWRTYVDTIAFAEDYDSTGKYIGFKILARNVSDATGTAYINEIEVVGVDYIPNYTVTTVAGTTSDSSNHENNLIAGQADTDYFKKLTDGLYADVGVGSAQSSWNTGVKFTYRFDATYKVNKVTVTSDASNYGAGKLRLGKYSIFISDSSSDLYNQENLVATVVGETSDYGAGKTVKDIIEFAENYDTTGSYLGIAVYVPTLDTASYPGAHIHEFEVEGTKIVYDWTVDTVVGSKNDTFDTSKNLIYGKEPAEFPGVTNIGFLTDGNSKNTRALVAVKTLSYDLGGATTVDGVRVISENTSGTANSRLGAYEIYVADTLEDLYSPENKVAEIDPASTDSTACTYIDTFAFSENYAKTGKWFGIKVLARSIASAEGTALFCEIEVMGTKKASVTATAGEGGTISPEGETVLNGTPIEYTFTPDEGYKLASVVVNGVVVENITDNKYTFTGTEEGSNTIEVTFALIGDTNNDGYLDDDDLDIIKQHILGLEEADPTFADLNGDGDITLLDLVTAYELQQGTDPAVASLKTTLGLNDAEYTSAINRAAAFNTSATATDRLNAVFAKAQSGQPITIAAIGGSITEGAGANVMSGVSVSAESLGVTVNGTTYENSKYVDRVANWFAGKFENTTVNKVNAGFSGTPSFLGTFRLEHDVLSHNPDLIIVEFSVNDLGNYQLDEGYMLDAYESVIRKSLESGAAVVAVFTVNNLTYQTTNIGNSWQNYHKLIADHYNIPTVSYHNAIYPNGQWITEWTKLSGDNVHPNVAGHALLANCITSYFEDVYEMDSHTATNIPATWYHNDTFANTDIVYFDNAEFNGMTKVASNKYGYIAKNTSGTGNESIKVKVPAGAKEIYVFYNTIANAGSVYTKLGDNAEIGPYSTNVSSIGYSHGEWSRIYNGDALSEDTDLTIRSANDGKALEILTVLVVK